MVKPVGKKNSGGLSRITSGVKTPPRRVQQLRESTLKKASSAGKCGGGLVLGVAGLGVRGVALVQEDNLV